jgi:membrane-bound serine protease (ClpP class)
LPAPPIGGPAAVIRLSGEIDDYNRDQLRLRFDRARAAGAKTIILEIDTYGGLVTSGLDISRFIKNQSDLHVIAFVNSKAISAGAMIALACNEIVMTPSGTLGDCAPIQIGESKMGDTERSKAESPVLADFKESALRNGYDPLLATAMVSLPITAHWIQDEQGNRRFVNDADYKSLTESGKWKVVAGAADPIDGDKTLLTLHSAEARQYGFSRGEAMNAEDLAAHRGFTLVARYESGFGDTLVGLLGGPIVRGLLLIIFLNALFLSLKTPGHGAPEAIALLSLGLLVGIPLLTGYAQWWEVGMIVIGLALICFEIFVFPGHLVSLIAGTLMVVVGLLLTFMGDIWSVPGSWNMPGTWTLLNRGITVTVGGLFGALVVFALLRKILPYTPYFRRLVLPSATPSNAPATPARGYFSVPAAVNDPEDHWPFVGTVGTAVSELKPGGNARFPYAADLKDTSVVSEAGYIAPGTKIIVREVHGNRVVVRPLA